MSSEKRNLSCDLPAHREGSVVWFPTVQVNEWLSSIVLRLSSVLNSCWCSDYTYHRNSKILASLWTSDVLEKFLRCPVLSVCACRPLLVSPYSVDTILLYFRHVCIASDAPCWWCCFMLHPHEYDFCVVFRLSTFSDCDNPCIWWVDRFFSHSLLFLCSTAVNFLLTQVNQFARSAFPRQLSDFWSGIQAVEESGFKRKWRGKEENYAKSRMLGSLRIKSQRPKPRMWRGDEQMCRCVAFPFIEGSNCSPTYSCFARSGPITFFRDAADVVQSFDCSESRNYRHWSQ